MVLYIVIKDDNYPGLDGEHGYILQMKPVPSKAEFIGMIKRSHNIWMTVASTVPEVKKTADTLATMLAKLESSVEKSDELSPSPYRPNNDSGSSLLGPQSTDPSPIDSVDKEADFLSSLGFGESTNMARCMQEKLLTIEQDQERHPLRMWGRAYSFRASGALPVEWEKG